MAVTTCCFFFPKTRRILRRNKDEATSNDGISWLDLPDDLLTIIVSRLSSEDYVRFASTCRRWQSIPDPRSRPIWLGCNGDCVLVDPFCVRNNLSFPELAGARVLSTRTGWLLLFKDNTLFFFCPSTREQRSLPDAGRRLECFRASFSSPPISSDCTVVVLLLNENSGNEALTWRRGECNWRAVHLGRFFDTSARLCGRCIYGWLGHMMLRMDPIKRICTGWSFPRDFVCSWLMEFEGDYYIVGRIGGGMFRVFIERERLPGAVEEIHCLGKRAIFLGNDGEGHMVTARGMVMANRIYFLDHRLLHRFHCYSLETQRLDVLDDGSDQLPQLPVGQGQYSSGDAASFWFEAA